MQVEASGIRFSLIFQFIFFGTLLEMELYKKEYLAPNIIFLAQKRELERIRLDEEMHIEQLKCLFH